MLRIVMDNGDFLEIIFAIRGQIECNIFGNNFFDRLFADRFGFYGLLAFLQKYIRKYGNIVFVIGQYFFPAEHFVLGISQSTPKFDSQCFVLNFLIFLIRFTVSVHSSRQSVAQLYPTPSLVFLFYCKTQQSRSYCHTDFLCFIYYSILFK